MMDIFIVVDNLNNGGAGRVASILANYMSLENNVYIVVKESRIGYQLSNKDNINVLVLNDKTPFFKIKVLNRIVHLTYLINKYHPDVIYSLGYVSKYTTFAKMFSKYKSTRIISSERSDPNSVPSSILMRYIRDYCFSKADVLVCQTFQAQEYYKRRVKVKTVVIPNPITPNLPFWKGFNSLNIVAACRLDEQKNLPMLIHAFNKLHKLYPRYKLFIYGEGHLKSYLFEIIHSLHLDDSVFLPGSITNIHDVLAKSFLYVSSSNHEGLSNSMLEALAIGVPSVCTDCPIGGASMLIEDKVNGFLTPVNDVDSFYEAMKFVIDNQKKLAQISLNAIKIREKLNPSEIAKSWIRLLY